MHRIPLTACALFSVSLVALHARAQQPAPKPQSSAGSWTQPAAAPAPAASAQAAPGPATAPAPRPVAPTPRPERSAPPGQGAHPDQGGGPPGHYTQPWYGPPEYAGQSGYYAQPGYGPPPGYYAPPPGYYAQPGYGPPPGYYAPPMGPDPATVHRHDGFYLRMSFGVGYLHDSANFDTTGVVNASSSAKFSGGVLAFDVMVGGTPVAGLVFGGGIIGAVAPNPRVKEGNVSTSSNMDLNLVLVSGFVDWYPNPREGFHLQGLAGIAAVSLVDRNGDSRTNRTPAGIGLGVGVGYEWWIANQWSIGVLGRVLYAHATVTDTYIDGSGMYDDTEKHSVIAPAVLFTAVYH